jgi:hypothetical protein
MGKCKKNKNRQKSQQMDRIYLNLLFILILIFGSCNSNLKKNSVIGFYKNSENSAKDFNELILRADSTYSLTQCPLAGDIWLNFNGCWETKENSIILYEGLDFSDFLVLDTLIDYNSDSLHIELDSTLLRKFPNIKLSVEKKNELNIIGTNVDLLKTKYLEKLDYKDYEYKYGDYPIVILLRYKNYYAYINYAFAYKKIKISIKEGLPINKRTILTKYMVNDSILNSYSENFKLKRNELKKLSKSRIEFYKGEL